MRISCLAIAIFAHGAKFALSSSSSQGVNLYPFNLTSAVDDGRNPQMVR
jgi:hypothetical protein